MALAEAVSAIRSAPPGENMSSTGRSAWLTELEKPSAGFFPACAARFRAEGGAAGAAAEAVLLLTPRIDWPAHLPHCPHGLLGLQGVFRLRPLLPPASFERLLATQLHGFALEARSPAGHGLAATGLGSGSWANLEMALAGHRPAIAWGEALAMPAPAAGDFLRLDQRVAADMANVGHKAVLARSLAELHQALGGAPELGRPLLAVAAWLGASEPFDTFWHDRAVRRLEGATPPAFRPAGPDGHADWVRAICDSGLVELLDRFSGIVRSGAGSGDLLAALVLAAAEKQLDARRDLEGRTAWNFVFLAGLAGRVAGTGGAAPETWVQAAALVNLFPTDEAEDRIQPRPPRNRTGSAAQDLLEAILDGEAAPAMFLTQATLAEAGGDAVLAVLAAAAAANDPAFNHSHQPLAVAAAAELLPFLPDPVAAAMLIALAKFLANSQGSSDLGRLADKALATG
jgi:hypothetical protein